jgi:hypothetical protein
LYGVYHDGFFGEDKLWKRLIIFLPLFATTILYITICILYGLIETILCRAGFKSIKHLNHFLRVVELLFKKKILAPLFSQVNILLLGIKWIFFNSREDLLWSYFSVPSILLYFGYTISCKNKNKKSKYNSGIQWIQKNQIKNHSKEQDTEFDNIIFYIHHNQYINRSTNYIISIKIG